jgi:hypothetical protein
LARLLIEPILEDARCGQRVDALPLLFAREMAGEFAFGIMGCEMLADTMDGNPLANGLHERKDKALGKLRLLRD